MKAKPLIELDGVGKSFLASDGTPRSVLEGVDFRLHEQEIVGLLGRSGSGKSTLLRIMAGLVLADKGEVRYRGQPIHDQHPIAQRAAAPPEGDGKRRARHANLVEVGDRPGRIRLRVFRLPLLDGGEQLLEPGQERGHLVVTPAPRRRRGSPMRAGRDRAHGRAARRRRDRSWPGS